MKFEVFNDLVGTPFDQLPAWIAHWSTVDPSLLSVADINRDGILQLGEMRIGGDIIVLATPEIGGLPYVISGMVAAGGLAAALSTADGLLLTIGNALSHDLLLQDDRPERVGQPARHDLEGAAAGGGAGGGQRGGAETGRHPVPGVGGVLARGRGLLPGAGAGHLLEARQQVGCRAAAWSPGSALTFYYMGDNAALAARRVRGHRRRSTLWFGIQPISAGVFGVPLGLRGDRRRRAC